MSERTVVGEAAELAAQHLSKSGKAAAFATLEGPDGQTGGVVLVCLDPNHIDRVIEFVLSLGNFSTHVPTAEEKAKWRD